MRKGGTTSFAHTSNLWGATLLFIPQMTSARPQEAQWQCSLQICISLPHVSHTQEKKDKFFIILPSGFSLTNYFTLLLSHFCCLSAWQAKFIQGCWAGIFLLQCSRRPCERSAAFNSPVTKLSGTVISHTFIRRVLQVTLVKSILENN